MAIYGDVSSLGLEDVFRFLAGNAQEGVLTVRGGNNASFRLYFRDGRIFIPYSDQEGIESLGKVLQPNGVITRAWGGLMHQLRKRSGRLRRIALKKAETVKRQYTEEIHSLFLWDEGHFEFAHGALPSLIDEELEAGRGLLVEPTAIVMEVARRSDERSLVRRMIPSGRVILRVQNEGKVAKALEEFAPEGKPSDFDGRTGLDALLEAWGASHMEALIAIASQIEAGFLAPISPEEAEALIDQALLEDDPRLAGTLLGHLIDVQPSRGSSVRLGPVGAFINSTAFKEGPEVTCAWRLDGQRLFLLAREALDSGAAFTLEFRLKERVLRIATLPGVLSVSSEGPWSTPPLKDYLLRLGMLPESLAERADTLSEETLHARAGSGSLERASLERLIEELADLAFWGSADVVLKNRGSIDGSSSSSLIVALNAKTVKRVRDGLRHWSWIFGSVPGEAAVYLRSKQTRRNDPAAKFFGRFSPARNVGELQRFAEAPRLKFAEFVAKGLKAGYLVRPNADQLERWAREAQQQNNHILAHRLIRAGSAFGYGPQFDELAEAYRGRQLATRPEPVLHGELSGTSLPAILQDLSRSRRSGVLKVTSGTREEKLHFFEGDAFVLRYTDTEGEDFVNFLLGDDKHDLVDPVQSVDESELGAQELRELKDSFLELMFLADATFAFYINDLPEEFFAPRQGVTKVALDTGRFLLEAVGAMDAWDGIRAKIGDGAAVLRFVDPDTKLNAVRERDCAQTLTLVDGRLSFDELVRLSGEDRLQVGRVCADLLAAGELQVVDAEFVSNGGPG